MHPPVFFLQADVGKHVKRRLKEIDCIGRAAVVKAVLRQAPCLISLKGAVSKRPPFIGVPHHAVFVFAAKDSVVIACFLIEKPHPCKAEDDVRIDAARFDEIGKDPLHVVMLLWRCEWFLHLFLLRRASYIAAT